MNKECKNIIYRYKFSFNDGSQKEFVITLDGRTLDLVRLEKDSNPEWTELGYNQCINCSLDKKENRFCPVAVNISDIVDFFRDSMSYEETDLLIECDERGYLKHTALQQAISSLVGIYMVTSGCPVMDKLRPMVRFHLPFASIEETKYRAISMYLFAQYFLYKRGENPDWDLKNLAKIYDDVRIVNESFCRRLTGIKVKDASLNALVRLDFFSTSIKMTINKDKIKDIESFFKSYFK